MNPVFQKPFALVANENEQGKNRGVVKAGHTFDRADRASLDKQFKSFGRFLHRGVHAVKRCGMIFSEGLGALAAAIALKAVAVLCKFLAFRLAIVAGHFGLPFCGSKPIMDFRSALRLAPRADFARSQFALRAGLSFFDLFILQGGWNRSRGCLSQNHRRSGRYRPHPTADEAAPSPSINCAAICSCSRYNFLLILRRFRTA